MSDVNAQSRQFVIADGGIAYGVVDGDLHVHGGSTGALLLGDWPSPSRSCPFEVLPAARDCLLSWLTGPTQLAVRWMYGRAACGKTQLAADLVGHARTRGWRVVRPVVGTDPSAALGGQTSRTLLAVIDDADRMALVDLTWLLSNALLFPDSGTTRVLLIARSLDQWPAVRAALARRPAWTDTQRVAPMPAESLG